MVPFHQNCQESILFTLAKNGWFCANTLKKLGLVQILIPAVLIPIIHQIFEDNEAAVADFKSGKRNADKAFTGFLMKATKGKSKPTSCLYIIGPRVGKIKRRLR